MLWKPNFYIYLSSAGMDAYSLWYMGLAIDAMPLHDPIYPSAVGSASGLPVQLPYPVWPTSLTYVGLPASLSAAGLSAPALSDAGMLFSGWLIVESLITVLVSANNKFNLYNCWAYWHTCILPCCIRCY